MNYQEIYEKWDELPDCRIRIALQGDDGENLWGKKLPLGLIGLNNAPLHKEYRWQDIVRRNGAKPEIVHRRWNHELVFDYEDKDDEHDSMNLREMIANEVSALGGDISFWCPGVGIALCETTEQLEAVTKALEAMDMGFAPQVPEEEDD